MEKRTLEQKQAPLSWLERNWKWAIPLAALVFLLVLCMFVGSLVLAVFAWMKSSTVSQEAIQRARLHPEVARSLGEPIETGWWISGNLSLEGSSGEARLTIPLHGPLGSAYLRLDAERSAGAWSFKVLEVEMKPGGPRVDLIH